MSRFRLTPALWDKIYHYSSFPPTGVSLQQMVLFGSHPNPGTLLKASQFLAEELPIRLSHRVKDLDELPDGLSEMEGVKRVKEWYAESFDELVSFPPPVLPPDIRDALMGPSASSAAGAGPSSTHFPSATDNPSLHFQMREGRQERDYEPIDEGAHSEAASGSGSRGGGLAGGKYDYGNGNGGNGTGSGAGATGSLAAAATRMRIPIERRWVPPVFLLVGMSCPSLAIAMEKRGQLGRRGCTGATRAAWQVIFDSRSDQLHSQGTHPGGPACAGVRDRVLRTWT